MPTHASIVPLIGGLTLGQEKAFGTKPEYFLSYSPFSNNDSHIVNHYSDVPYLLLDKGEKHPKYVDVVNATCPCAGLSALSGHASSDADANNWMYESTEYVLKNIKPRVLWGENAPTLAGKIGEPVVKKLFAIARDNGYTMSVYRTKSLLHGVPQIRERSFYFFWQGDNVPLLGYFNKPLQTIEQLLDSVPKDSGQNTPINEGTPSKDDPFYRYVLEEVEGGITHEEFYNRITKTDNPMDWIERKGIKYDKVGEWMHANGYDRVGDRCDRIAVKLAEGGNIMRRCTMIPKNHIGAFVGHYPNMLTHYKEDRYITYREAMAIMGLPHDFELLNQKRFTNHICQNVPVGTASDMGSEVLAVLEGRRPFIDAKLVYQYNAQQKHNIVEGGAQPSTLESFF